MVLSHVTQPLNELVSERVVSWFDPLQERAVMQYKWFVVACPLIGRVARDREVRLISPQDERYLVCCILCAKSIWIN